ncbi:MAG TPA: ATPase, T2SS/T4P/T4SS family [Steroidobacteraceae bacterium]|jgi:twitching motility protein PilT|nr:ATPase, T2SS/T4P/T4SS family [Steroidobacteraceae bacterium]
MQFQEWIEQAYSLGASDLHLEADTPIVARIRGELQTVGGVVPGATLQQVAHDLLGAERWPELLERGSADLSESVGGIRLRANFFQTVRGLGLAIRLLAPSVKDLRSCNLHRDLRKLVEPLSGLVIISGPTGSGKSTTLAALLEEINASRARHMITLESPIEYLFANRQSFIRQREIPTHSPSFEQAIIDALRENPDVLVISEMRTPEVMRLTLNAAETGHLVLATMHSASCAEALSRLCMSFPSDIQPSVRAQLADCLVAVCCQRLEFLAAYRLHVPRCEILLPTSGAKGTIRSGNFSQIATVLQSGGEEGMWTFDRYQRWMDQVSDWVRPPTAATLRGTADSAPPPRPTPGLKATLKPPAGRQAAASASPAAGAPPAAGAATRNSPAQPAARSAPGVKPASDDVIEVPAEDLDLAQLAELAKKVVERKP